MTDSKPSKSARKREQLDLQQLGEQLITLSDSELASLTLDDSLDKAVRDAAKIKSRSALRRQKQLIGKLMRGVDPEPIRAELAKLTTDDLSIKRGFARAEHWRDRIVCDSGTALDDFEAETGAADDQLRALLRELDAACSEKAEKTARRQIFRRIHEILVRILR